MKYLFITFFYYYIQDDITAAVKVLLSLKEEFTKTTGEKWTPELIKKCTKATTTAPTATTTASNGQDLLVKIESQGAKVRELKSAKASKVFIFLFI